LSLRQRLKRRRLVGELAQLDRGYFFSQDARVGRALLRRDTLAGDRVDTGDRAAFFDQKLRAGVEKGQAEIDALAPLLGVGHGLGDEIDGVRAEQWNPRGRSGFLLFDLDRLADLLGQSRRDKLLREINGETDPAILLIDVSEGRRAGSRADGESPGARDFFQRGFGPDRARAQRRRGQ
jgi:hypothetical protein